jgi:hypothetical protein
MYLCVCVHLHTYIHIQIRIRIHIHIHIHTDTHTHIRCIYLILDAALECFNRDGQEKILGGIVWGRGDIKSTRGNRHLRDEGAGCRV